MDIDVVIKEHQWQDIYRYHRARIVYAGCFLFAILIVLGIITGKNVTTLQAIFFDLRVVEEVNEYRY